MEMNDVEMRLPERPKESLCGVRQVQSHIRPHRKPFPLHLLTQCAESPDRIDSRIVPLFSLQTAQLRHKYLCSTNLHAVNYVRNLHVFRPDLEYNCTGKSSASVVHRASCLPA
jgi:hypothetical protein